MSKRIILRAKIIIISRINEQFLLFFYFCTSFAEFSYLCSQMAILHIFNPEHDIALAANLSNFTSPHAGRQLRHDLGYLPAIWAAADDYVLVENVEDAQRDYARLMHRQFKGFIDKRQLSVLSSQFSVVSPWGWDLALRSFLLRYGVDAVPSEEEIAEIRDLSHRKHAVSLLRELAFKGTIGSSWQADTIVEVRQALRNYSQIVIKAPWSSSGRGIRFIDNELNDYQERWVRNVIARQGSIVIEKYCHKVKDFGMEFESDGRGNVRYLGLSLFHTQNGAYTGNILATEEEKRDMIKHYLPDVLIDSVQQKICEVLGTLYQGRYAGPFGVDMMIVRDDDHLQSSMFNVQYLLNPCVEINLRRTMGHVALELSKRCRSEQVMVIEYAENHYKLKIRKQ